MFKKETREAMSGFQEVLQIKFGQRQGGGDILLGILAAQVLKAAAVLRLQGLFLPKQQIIHADMAAA